MPTTSLRRSAVLAFFYFGAVLIGLYAVVAALTAAFLEDRVLVRRLEIEVEEYLGRLQGLPRDQILAPPSTRFMQGYIGLESVPPSLQPWVSDKSDGFHEAGEEVPGRSRPFVVAIRHLPDNRGRLFLFYEVTRLGVRGEWIGTIAIVLSSGALIVGLLGIWWGRRLAARLVAPVVHLADTVENSPTSELAARIGAENAQDYPIEVAQLAGTLHDALGRIESFMHRERSFTRNASHELRTPVTVARGAAELLASRLPGDDPRARRQLDRIFRAVHRMEDTIEACLWLAREDGRGSLERCCPADVMPEIIARHRHLLGDRPVRVVLDFDPKLEVASPSAVFAIVAGKLIANAFYRTHAGSVEIGMRGEILRIVDTGTGGPAEPSDPSAEPVVSGHPKGSHGQPIVREICERLGWSLRDTPRTPHGTCTELYFVTQGATSS